MTTVIDQERVNVFMAIWLKVGAHDNFDQGMCVMEASAWLAHEPWSDKPLCVSPVVGAFLRLWNDQLDATTRQKLKPYAARVVGTAGDGHDEWRGWLCVDWLARTNLPMWLDLAGFDKHATAVRSLAEIVDDASAEAARPILSAAESVTGASAWAAAGQALGLEAWEAARSTARSAADLAAEPAAESKAWAAAWTALAPSVRALQASAFVLLDRMIEGPQ